MKIFLRSALSAFLSITAIAASFAQNTDKLPPGSTPIGAEVSPAPQPARLLNVSARALIGQGENALIGGFILTGSMDKTTVMRALGPSLPVSNKMPNPRLQVFNQSGTMIDFNNDWVNSPDKQGILDSTLEPSNDLEAASVKTLAPGAYTVVVYGQTANDFGVGTAEIFDINPESTAQLANISARGLTQPGNNVLIGGFITGGTNNLSVIVRALGPSLNLTGALADPTLELRNANGDLLAANDSWRSNQEAEIIASTVPPTRDEEAAIVQSLTPGAYTAILRGARNTSGVAAIEIYALE